MDVSFCQSANTVVSIYSSPLEKVAYEFIFLLQLCQTCLVLLSWMVCEMGGLWPYNYSSVGCCFQDLFKTTHSVLVLLSSCFFSMFLVIVQVVKLYSSIVCIAWKKSHFILLVRSDFHVADNLSIVRPCFTSAYVNCF